MRVRFPPECIPFGDYSIYQNTMTPTEKLLAKALAEAQLLNSDAQLSNAEAITAISIVTCDALRAVGCSTPEDVEEWGKDYKKYYPNEGEA